MRVSAILTGYFLTLEFQEFSKNIFLTFFFQMPKVTHKKIELPEIEADTITTVTHDVDTGVVTVKLSTGVEMTFCEPKGKHFVETESWISTAPDERKSVQFFILKLAHSCWQSPKKPNFEGFLDLLEEYDDMIDVSRAISFFRDKLESYFERVQQNAIDMGMSEKSV